MVSFDDATRVRIANAVTVAEATTDAEIVPVVARASDRYHDVALHWIVLGMLLALAIVAAVPEPIVAALERIRGGWDQGLPTGWLVSALIVLVAIVFLVLRLMSTPLSVRMALTPGGTKARRVRRRAVLLFRTGIEMRTASRTGVLLYLSLAERRAEIVTDAAVLAKVPAEAWGHAMHALIDALRDDRAGDGMVAAIGQVGAVLAEHFPHTGDDPNELPDRLIEL